MHHVDQHDIFRPETAGQDDLGISLDGGSQHVLRLFGPSEAPQELSSSMNSDRSFTAMATEISLSFDLFD